MKMVRMMSQRGTLAGKGDGEGQYGLGFCICWGGRSGRYSEEKKRIGVRRTIVITEEFGSSRAPSKRSSRPPSSSKASSSSSSSSGDWEVRGDDGVGALELAVARAPSVALADQEASPAVLWGLS